MRDAVGGFGKRLYRHSDVARHVERQPACSKDQQQGDDAELQNINRLDAFDLVFEIVKLRVLLVDIRHARRQFRRKFAGNDQQSRLMRGLGDADAGNDIDDRRAVALIAAGEGRGVVERMLLGGVEGFLYVLLGGLIAGFNRQTISARNDAHQRQIVFAHLLANGLLKVDAFEVAARWHGQTAGNGASDACQLGLFFLEVFAFDDVCIIDDLPRRFAEPAIKAAIEQTESEKEEQQRRQQRQADGISHEPRLELRPQSSSAALTHQLDDVTQQDE